MSNTVISVEELSKQYRLGMVGAGTLREDLVGLWYKLRGKKDPYASLGETNDRSITGTSDYVWALKDVNFTVKKGEVLGIIGKNGAGKSTLLKLLSRVTSPTTGAIKANGRIASLLEVGTGFHPELTGRENIFLNGAIMGMKRHEIKAKLDEIIDFAGVQRYVDTPVKRYSSGMYVRLAFAVAAHLEPEILIVDEVLAVGDAEFQKKAIGKMQDVSSGQGRTVLFVSHNMKAVKALCTRAILMENGTLKQEGTTESIVNSYLKKSGLDSARTKFTSSEIEQCEEITIQSGKLTNEFPITTNDTVTFQFALSCNRDIYFHFNIHICSDDGEVLFVASSEAIQGTIGSTFLTEFKLPNPLLNEKTYRVKVSLVKDKSKTIHMIEDALLFSVSQVETSLSWYGTTPGLIRPEVQSSIERTSIISDLAD